MPVIAPAQSSLRVMPTAPVVQPELFIQQPNPVAGLQMFEQAAKLPLLMEQIKLEKYRQKAEKAKLDLAEQEANWRSQNFEKLAQQQQVLADVQLQAAKQGLAAQQIQMRGQELQNIANTPVSLQTAAKPAPVEQPSLPGIEWTDVQIGDTEKGVLSGATVTESVAAPTAAAPAAPQRFDLVTEIDNYVQRRAAGRNLSPVQVSALRKEAADLINPQPFKRIVKDEQGNEWEESGVLIYGTQEVSTNPRRLVARAAAVDAADKEFAKWRQEYLTQGKTAQLASNIGSLKDAVSTLRSGKNITGPITSLVPDRAMAIFRPEALAARQRVENVMQQSLREILGGQFAQKEGEQLLKRAFDARLGEEENAKRAEFLLGTLQNAVKIRGDMSNYFDQHNTLAGYKGPSIEGLSEEVYKQLQAVTEKDAAKASGGTAGKDTTVEKAKGDALNSYIEKLKAKRG